MKKDEKGGLSLWCSNCKDLEVCASLPLERMGLSRERRFFKTDNDDIQWFRRCRECQACGFVFLTAEVEESALHELAQLRRRLIPRNRRAVQKIRRKVNWLKRNETVPREIAVGLIEASAWWIDHPYGPCRSEGDAKHIFQTGYGWALKFGDNWFLVGKAIERCKESLETFFDSLSSGPMPPLES